MIRERRPNLFPAFVGAAALHAGLAAFAWLMWPKEISDLIVSAVPVTIVSDAPATAPDISMDPPAAEPAPEEVAEAPPPPPEPVPPEPTPAPPEKLTPDPAPKKKKADPPRQTPRQAERSDRWIEDLASDLSRNAKKLRPDAPPAKKSGGAPERGPLSITGQVALDALTRRLTENWNLNCGAAGFDQINPVVRFRLSEQGELVDGPRVVGGRSDPAWRTGAQRALNAVRAGEPYRGLPAELLNRNIEIAFRAEVACQG